MIKTLPKDKIIFKMYSSNSIRYNKGAFATDIVRKLQGISRKELLQWPIIFPDRLKHIAIAECPLQKLPNVT